MATTPPIVPCLWFDDQGEQAAEFYTSLFPDSGILSTTRYGKAGSEVHGRPEGSVMTADFQLAGQRFVALNAGPVFKFTPAVSFFVVCETEEEVDTLWAALSEDGQTLMELGKYDWSSKYGWLSDRFGLSWQISLNRFDDVGQKITPMLLFTGEQCGRAEEAMSRYTATFDGSAIDGVLRYGAGDAAPEGSVQHAQFSLGRYKFMVMDSPLPDPFTFTEAISFQVLCERQAEIDHFWERLGEGGDPKAQQCGWLKDEFGVSWQVVPAALPRMLTDGDAQTAARVTNAFMQMKKFDLGELHRAYEGAPR